jgi:hypothetical protein
VKRRRENETKTKNGDRTFPDISPPTRFPWDSKPAAEGGVKYLKQVHVVENTTNQHTAIVAQQRLL